MGQALDTADAVLKEDYHGTYTEQLNNANVLLAMAERDSESTDSGGRRFVRALHVGRNTGKGARAENVALPVAGNQRYVNAIGPLRYMYVSIELTGQAIKQMAKNKWAFIRAVEPESSGAVEDGRRDMCRQLWGTANGVIATCGVTTASTTVVLATTTSEKQLRDLDEGRHVDIGTVANPVLRATNRNVTDVDFAAKTITISGAAVTTAATDFVFNSGSGGASDNSGNPGDGQVEWTGIQHIVDDTTVLNTIDPATEGQWASRVTDSVGALSEQDVNSEIMKTEIKSGKVVDALVGSDGTFRAYSGVLINAKRFTDTEIELRGGYSAIKIGTAQMGRKGGKKLGLTWDRDCPNGDLYGFCMDEFVQYELADWDWIDQGGGRILDQKVDSTGRFDAYVGYLTKYGEFSTTRRNAHFVLHGITEV